MSAPLNAKALRRAAEQAAARRSVAPGRMQYTVASTIAMQMVPDGAATGGGAIRHRVSETKARMGGRQHRSSRRATRYRYSSTDAAKGAG